MMRCEQNETSAEKQTASNVGKCVCPAERKAVSHILKAYAYYMNNLSKCQPDEDTARYIMDNWNKDFARIEMD